MSKFVLALPSKGRLQEQMMAFLDDCGLSVSQDGGGRFYGARIPALPDVELRLMASSEIAAALRDGDIHAGVTGEDLLRETDPDLKRIALVKPLGFGRADLVVAAPQSWIDVSTMADLEAVCAAFHQRSGRRLRVATKYLVLTHAFFDRHGLDDYRLIESAGATEGAPASGAAELIVDITTTGQTLADNHLKILSDGLILKSQAQLAASRAARWDGEVLAAFAKVLDAIEARGRAKSLRILRVSGGQSAPLLACAHDMGVTLVGSAGGLEFHCPASRVAEACAALQSAGAATIAVLAPDYIFAKPNLVYDAFTASLAAKA
jgi:ATP phosphoribosyltransferase